MPAAAIVGVAMSAGAATAAIGAIATAGAAALTVGSVASIATFVGSVTTVVGYATGDDNLVRIGGTLAAVGGVTSLAANSWKLFGEAQTLSASLNTAKTLSDASAAVETGANLDFSLGGSAPQPEVTLSDSATPAPSLGSPGGPPVEGVGTPPVGDVSGNGLLSASTPAAPTTGVPEVSGTMVDTSLPQNMAEFNSVELGKFGVSTPEAAAPSAPAGDFSFSALDDFFNSPSGKGLLEDISGAAKGYASFTKMESENKLRDSQRKYYDSKRGLLDFQRNNMQAAGRLYT